MKRNLKNRNGVKVLWVSHLVPYPPKGGVLQRSFNLIKEVSKRHDIHIVAFNQAALSPSRRSLQEAISALSRYCCGLDVVPLPSDKHVMVRYWLILKSFVTPKPYTVNWNQSRFMRRVLGEAVASFNPDLIHYDTIGLCEYSVGKGRTVHVLNHHNIESKMMMRRAGKEKNMLKKVYFYREAKKIQNYEKKMCKLCDCNLTVSEDDLMALREVVPESNAQVIPNGVDTSYFSPSGKCKNENSLIFAGGMNWYPNKDAMLFFVKEIWPLLKMWRPAVKMTVIGQSPPKGLVELSKRDPDFIITGYVDDVRPYFRDASIFVCPIRDGGGTRLKILDALSAGIPVVATGTAAEGIEVTDKKNIIIADDAVDITRKIISLLENKELRMRLSWEGRRLVEERYEWSIIGQKLVDLYISLVK